MEKIIQNRLKVCSWVSFSRSFAGNLQEYLCELMHRSFIPLKTFVLFQLKLKERLENGVFVDADLDVTLRAQTKQPLIRLPVVRFSMVE